MCICVCVYIYIYIYTYVYVDTAILGATIQTVGDSTQG